MKIYHFKKETIDTTSMLAKRSDPVMARGRSAMWSGTSQTAQNLTVFRYMSDMQRQPGLKTQNFSQLIILQNSRRNKK